jgi:non-heme chloroperoxidase
MRSIDRLLCLLAAVGTMAFPNLVTASPPEAASAVEGSAAEASAPSSVRVNGVELHYVDRGTGVPIVFIHGGLADYREWLPAADALPDEFRTVAYSRRFSFPNRNAPPGSDHSMQRDVEDAAALIEKLDLGPVHIVGSSYGAFTSLMLALHRPDLVRTVTAAEPPLLHWLPDVADGREAHDHFYRAVMTPSAAAFADEDPVGAVAVAVDYFVGPDGINQIPAEFRDMLLANVEDWRAITTSPGSLPRVTREQIAAIAVPVLLISGGRSADVHRLVDPEVERVLPHATRVIIAEGTHDMCSEHPAACAAAIASFIERQER